jgi:hypothetical protein
MKKKSLEVKKKKNSDKNKKFKLSQFFKISANFRNNRNRFVKYRVANIFFKIFKNLIFKKEFYLMKSIIFNLQYRYDYCYTINPVFEYEKQFLFKQIEYNTLINESNIIPIFLKNNYKFYESENLGSSYLIKNNLFLKNDDFKNPIFVNKYEYDNYYIKNNLIKNNLFEFNINNNIFFFLLIDFYKILVFLNFLK